MEASGGSEQQPSGLARAVDWSLPWVAGSSVLAGVLVTAFSGVPAKLPGIALSSTPLFHLERAGAVVAAVIIITGLLARTLKRELPTAFSPTTGGITYPDKVIAATTASDSAAAALNARLDKEEAELLKQRDNIGKLAEALDGAVGEIERLRHPADRVSS